MTDKYNFQYLRIKNAWEHAGFKKASDFSKASGIKTATISQWKTGRGKENKAVVPSVDQFMKICNTCGCDIDYLLGKITTFRRVNQSISDKTGLSEAAIDKLSGYNAIPPEYKVYSRRIVADFISHLITSDEFENVCWYIQEIKNKQQNNCGGDPPGADTNRNEKGVPPIIKIAEAERQDREFLEFMLTKDIIAIIHDYIDSNEIE